MDCPAFRTKHTPYVDGVLSGEDADAMRKHMRSCEPCASHDARIRRALFLVRNIPTVEPAADFQERLFRRLKGERARIANARHLPAGPSVRAFAASAASLIFIGILTVGGLQWFREDGEPPRLPAVVVQPPARLDSLTAPAIVAAMSAGMAVWPALWIAEEAPFRYVSDAGR